MNSMDYRPSDKTFERLKKVSFVAVVGPTAAGKSTLISAAMEREPSIHLVLSNTTRSPRPGEQEGVDFRFLDRNTIETRIARGEYAQVAPSVFGDLYATAAEDYSVHGIAVMPVLAVAVPVFRSLPFKRCKAVFVLPPNWEIWQGRIARHGFTAEQLARRMDEAKQSLAFALKDKEVLFIINQNTSVAAQDFITLAFDKPLSPRLQTDQTRAQVIVRDLLEKAEEAVSSRQK
ncbi:MAG TPA: GTPase [Candidatus Saccharimonadales bacterium]|nr:GTPase [Candidatus Saccharimonadales bacterium]